MASLSLSTRIPPNTRKYIRRYLAFFLGLCGLLGCSGGKGAPSPLTTPTPPSVVTVKAGPNLLHSRKVHSAILLADGRVGIVGGSGPYGNLVPVCEIYDPQSGQFTEAGSLAVPRVKPALLLMEDGLVLVIGGTHGNTDSKDLEMWDPLHRSSTWVGAIQTAQGWGVSATRLPDGKILSSEGDIKTLISLTPRRGAAKSCLFKLPIKGLVRPLVSSPQVT
jgi:hypothetical protein